MSFSRVAKLARRAARLSGFDKLSSAVNGHKKEAKYTLTTQNAGPKALDMVRQILGNYTLPNKPVLGYSGVRNLRSASNNKLQSGVVTIHAEFKTRTGVNVGIDVPVEIRDGELVEPSVVVMNGQPKIIAQSSFDTIIEYNSARGPESLRDMYDPPMTKHHNQMALDNRKQNVRVNKGMFATASRQAQLRNIVAGKQAQLEDFAPIREKDEHNPDARFAWYGLLPDGTVQVELRGHNGAITTYDFANAQEMKNVAEARGWDLIPEVMSEPIADQDLYYQSQVNSGSGRSPADVELDLAATYDDLARKWKEYAKREFPGRPLHKESPLMKVIVKYEQLRDHALAKAERLEQEFAKDAQYIEDFDYKDVDPAKDSRENHLDPAEDYDDFDICVGSEYSLKEDIEIKERGGAVWEYNKGSKVTVIRDHAGDNTSFVVEFEDGCQAIVGRHFLKE